MNADHAEGRSQGRTGLCLRGRFNELEESEKEKEEMRQLMAGESSVLLELTSWTPCSF